MGNRKLVLILRFTFLALVVLGAFVLLPAVAQALCTPFAHGVNILKSCISPKNRCATDTDCSEPDFCNGQCATEENPGSNVVDCDIRLGNPESHCDDVTLWDAADEVLNATGPGASSSAILITSATGVVSGTCTAGTDLGGLFTHCRIAPGGDVHFQANYYTVDPNDPTTLIDQATITVQDNCNNSPEGGCSQALTQLTFATSTTTESGCLLSSLREFICFIVLIKKEIILLPGEIFPAPGNRQALLSGLDTIERDVEDQKFDDAGEVLRDLRKHLDGCTSADGTPDRNDWINSCAEQIRIRSLIDEVIAGIAEFQRQRE